MVVAHICCVCGHAISVQFAGRAGLGISSLNVERGVGAGGDSLTLLDYVMTLTFHIHALRGSGGCLMRRRRGGSSSSSSGMVGGLLLVLPLLAGQAAVVAAGGRTVQVRREMCEESPWRREAL